MFRRDLTPASRFNLLIGQLIIILMCVLYTGYFYTNHIKPDRINPELFSQANCLIVAKTLSTRGFLINIYRADFLIHYTLNGIRYNRWVSGNGFDNSYFGSMAGQEAILSGYNVGETYPCWYDPDQPESVYLTARKNWLSAFPIIVPILLGLGTLYYFLKNVWNLLMGSARRN